MMSVRDRIQRYRETGGAADLVRVEVLVPASCRDDIVAKAAEMRESYRQRKAQLQQQMDLALKLYGVRILDNIDLGRLDDLSKRARVIAKALIERGDARAFAMGRRLLADVEG
jgi:hypothetical protein